MFSRGVTPTHGIHWIDRLSNTGTAIYYYTGGYDAGLFHLLNTGTTQVLMNAGTMIAQKKKKKNQST